MPRTATPPDDLVTDILDRLAYKVGVMPRRLALEIDREVRKEWGGETHYIARNGAAARFELLQRDERIRADARRGEHIPLLARRHNISEKRVRQIIANDPRAC